MDIEQEAKLQGWVPQEEFKGEESKWVDAETFIEKGQHILPIMRSNNKRLVTDLDSVKAEVISLKKALATQTQSMEELKIFHQESSKAQVEKARRDLVAELKEAKRDGDIDQEIQLTADLSKFDAAQVGVDSEKPKKVNQQNTQNTQEDLHPDTQAWLNINSWYGTDDEKTGLMDGICRKLRREGSSLTGLPFLMEAHNRVESFYGKEKTTPVSKAESGRATNGGGGSSAKGYAGLPAEAKAICDRQAERFVGANKVYKTTKEWQDFYVAEYNKGN